MKDIKVVIGANFGDEGKGLLTDYFASSAGNGIVVRFNGGAQAGHTVTTGDGRRHAFGHIGSGAFAGLPTFLSSFFVVNPLLFNKELKALRELNAAPEVYADKDCPVTTPYDMLINQLIETVRGASRHGSCGLGFNETITRCLAGDPFSLTLKELTNLELLEKKLINIRDKYVPERLKQLGIKDFPGNYRSLLQNESIIENYIFDIEDMLDNLTAADTSILKSYDSIIFEGAQGLLLDQNHEYFPHVTRSNTGIKNVCRLLEEAGLMAERPEIIYATRAYLTRHGAGPFPTELAEKPYPRIEDLTNIPNPYQGTLRFGLLDLDSLSKEISNDLKNSGALNYSASLAVTCLDQIDDKIEYILNSVRIKSGVEDFLRAALRTVKVEKCYTSYGPTRSTIFPVTNI